MTATELIADPHSELHGKTDAFRLSTLGTMGKIATGEGACNTPTRLNTTAFREDGHVGTKF